MRALPWILAAGVVGTLALTASKSKASPPDQGGGALPPLTPLPGGRPPCDPALVQRATTQIAQAQAEILNAPAGALGRTSPGELVATAAAIDACTPPAGLGPVPTEPLSAQLRTIAQTLATRRGQIDVLNIR